jgi:hypothetical protein
MIRVTISVGLALLTIGLITSCSRHNLNPEQTVSDASANQPPAKSGGTGSRKTKYYKSIIDARRDQPDAAEGQYGDGYGPGL